MKRRFLAGLLAIALSISMSTTTFAAELPQEGTVQQSVEGAEEQVIVDADGMAEETAEGTSEDKTDGEVDKPTVEADESQAEKPKETEKPVAFEGEKVEAKTKEAETSAWTAEDFTYEQMSVRLYGCDYSREFKVAGLAVSGFSETGVKKLETNKDLIIPAKSPDGTSVMGVTAGAFKEKGLTSVKFPEGCIVPYDDTVTHVVTERGNFIIGESAFAKNNLTEVSLPEGVIAVMTSAFDMNKLEKVTLPSTIWWIENFSFRSNNISTVNFPKTCTFQLEIHGSAFAKNNIKSVRLPDYTLVVNKHVFIYNPGMESVPSHAPSGESDMGGVVYMYTDNPNLANMERIHHIERKNETQVSWHQKLIVAAKPEVDNTWKTSDFTFEGTAVTGFTTSGLTKSESNKELVLPDKNPSGRAITAVKGTFKAKGTPFKYIQIPESVTEIGDSVFAGAEITKLTLPSKVEKIGKEAFKGNKLSKLSVPGTVEVIAASSFAQSEACLKELVLGEGVQTLEAEAFANSALTKVNLPDSLMTLDKDTFKREGAEKVILYTNVENSFPTSEYHQVKLNLGDWNDKDFTYDETGKVVTGFTEVGKKKAEDNHNLVIPDKSTSGEWITEIGDAATTGLFSGEGCYYDSVKLPKQLEKIGQKAFIGSKVKKVAFPETLKEIGNMAFKDNELVEINLPDSVDTLGSAAFMGNVTLNKIVLSKSLKEIPASAFSNTSKSAPYSELIIPDGVTEIGSGAFTGHSLKKLEIPSSVTTISSRAFSNGEGQETLEELILHEGLEKISSNSFKCSKLKSVKLPTTVTKLDKKTFFAGVNKVIVYVDSMEQYTNFSALKNDGHEVRINPGPWTTDDFTYDGTIVTGFSEKGLLKRADKKELTIPDQTPEGEWVTEIAATELSDADGLFGGEGVVFETVVLPAKLEVIGIGAFRGQGIQKVTFPNTLTSIGNLAFQTNELREIILPDSVTSLGTAAFAVNAHVEKLVLSKNLTIIPKTVFGNTGTDIAPYKELVIPEGVTKIESNAFTGNSLSKIEIPKSVTEIGRGAFMNTSEHSPLREVILHEGLEKIGSNAFGYSQIRSVDLPTTVKERKALNATAFSNASYGNPVVWVNSQEQLDTLKDGLRNPSFELRNKNEFTYEVKGNEATITGLGKGVSVGEVLVLPRTSPEGKMITEIADTENVKGGTFTQNSTDFKATIYKEVVLPTGLKRIGNYAFQWNKVEKVNFPEGLEEIGEGAFNFCNLTNIILPDSVVKIGENVFSSNENLTKVVLSKSLTEIPERAFQHSDTKKGLVNFTELELPDGIITIGNYAFANNHLSKLVIPDSVKVIGANAFAQTSGGRKLESLKLSKNLTEIGNSAFKNSALTYVTIPESLTTLKSTSFQNGKNGIVFLYANNEKQLEKNGTTYVPEGKGHKVILEDMLNHGWTFDDFTYEGTTVTGWSEQGNITRKENLNLVVPSVNPITGEAITAIGDAAFQIPSDEWDQGHTGVESVNGMVTVKIPRTVTKIGNNAFQYNNLETVALPEGLVSIGDNAFNSNKLKAVSLPDSVTEMKPGAFSANDITELKLSKGLTKLESGVFSSNIHLTHVELPETITEIGDYAFSGDRIASIVIPKSVIKIGKSAFKLHRMTEITIPGNVKEIGDSAFEGTYKAITMKKVVLEEGIEKIGSLAFRMGYLEEVVIPKSITAVAPDAFRDNTGYNNSKTVRCYTENLAHMDFKVDSCQEFVFKAPWTKDCFEYAGTTIIGFSEKGLQYVKYMKDVVLPDKNPNGDWITSINAGAFKGRGITSVKLPSHLVNIGEEAFADNKITEVTLPESAINVAANAFDKGVKINKIVKPSTNGDGNNTGKTDKNKGNNDKNAVAKTADEAPLMPFAMTVVIACAVIMYVKNKKRSIR